MENIIIDEYDHVAKCEQCGAYDPAERLTEYLTYHICPACIDAIADNELQHRDYEGSV